MIYKFYDTCSVLKDVDQLFQDDNQKLILSSITLEELENIKTASNKDAEIKHSARKATRLLDENYGRYEIVFFDLELQQKMEQQGIMLTNDSKIIQCAISYVEKKKPESFFFVTNDINCKHLARRYFGNKVISVKEEDSDYDGYKEVYLDEDEMAYFYLNQDQNLFNLYPNQYLIIYNAETREVVDKFCWTGEKYRPIGFYNFNSHFFGDIKPMSGDVYQALVADSFMKNKITMVKGPAGSGKTYLSLGFLMYQLEKHRIDKIIVFCNTVATKGAARLG